VYEMTRTAHAANKRARSHCWN